MIISGITVVNSSIDSRPAWVGPSMAKNRRSVATPKPTERLCTMRASSARLPAVVGSPADAVGAMSSVVTPRRTPVTCV